VVAVDVNLGLDGITAEIKVDALDVNLASDRFEPERHSPGSNWSRAFDLDGDGEYDDVLDPARSADAGDLSIDYPCSLQLRVRGSLTAPAPTPTIRNSATSTPTSMATM
jgi:hypothetical protein